MNIVILGLGEVGLHLAKVLSGEGHAVTVIDTDPDRLRRVSDVLDVQTVEGDGARPDVLDTADVPRADLLLAVSNDDHVNMLCCLFGKRMGARKTVLRLQDVGPFRKSRTLLRANLLFDLLLSLDDLAAEEVVKTIRQNQAVGVENFAEGRIQMRQLRFGEDSKLLGLPIKNLKIPDGVHIAAIDREHEIIIPGGEDAIQSSDEVLVLGEPKSISAFEKQTGVRDTYLRSVVIYGHTGVVLQVCEALQRLHTDIKIIADDREQAEQLSDRLEGVLVLHADATDLAFLQEEHVGSADAFLGLSPFDERNLMSCQLARTLGVQRTLALVNKPDYVAIYQQLGIDVAVSPRLLCANRILGFVRSGSVSTIAIIEEGQAEVLEVEVKPGSTLDGKKLKDAGLPRGCSIGAIWREDGEILVPKGDDEIRAMDNLVLFVKIEKDVLDKVLKLCGRA